MPDDVGQQVARIGEQRQTVSGHSPDDFDGKGNQTEDKDGEQAPACGPGGRDVCVRHQVVNVENIGRILAPR